jgi:hypothetical protein
MLNFNVMKNLDGLLSEVLGVSKSKEGFSVNSVLFEILKDGKKLSREELKLEMLKFRFISKFGEFKDEYFKDVKMLEEIKKLGVVSRNSIDTIISKNNRDFIFKDIKGFEKCKINLENGKYFIK